MWGLWGLKISHLALFYINNEREFFGFFVSKPHVFCFAKLVVRWRHILNINFQARKRALNQKKTRENDPKLGVSDVSDHVL